MQAKVCVVICGFGSSCLAFCCVGALEIVNAIDLIDKDLLGWWLCERQVSSGGLNGRPEKLADVCYSWWVLSSLASIEKLDWIDQEKLKEFILECQDEEEGGISDKPGNVHDVYHTCFGVTGANHPSRLRWSHSRFVTTGLSWSGAD